MTLEDAIMEARQIQADLEQGRLTSPYPEPVRKTILRCCGVFMAHATDTETARALVARLNAPEPGAGEVPW